MSETKRGWFNFHGHSHYCDGIGAPIDYVAKATMLGMKVLGFSSHAPVPFDCKWCMKQEDLKKYIQEVDALKNLQAGLEVYTSLEIDFIPGKIAPADFEGELDYTIGSVHFTDAFADGKPWEIDGPHAPFLEGLQEIFQGDMKAAVTRYFEITREMIASSPPTIIGHLDKIKIQNQGDKFFKESDAWYKEEIKKTLAAIAGAGCIVEVNTRGIYQKKSTTTYPSPWIIELLHDDDIPVTLSSDAHQVSDLTNQFPETAIMLKKIGIKKLSVLHEGSWRKYDYDIDGIITG